MIPHPPARQFHTFLTLEFGGWIAISLVGLLTLRSLWHRAARRGGGRSVPRTSTAS